MNKILVLIMLCSPLVACGPSPEEIASQTQNAAIVTAASWTLTPTDAPTPTVVPTSTITATPEFLKHFSTNLRLNMSV